MAKAIKISNRITDESLSEMFAFTKMDSTVRMNTTKAETAMTAKAKSANEMGFIACYQACSRFVIASLK